MGSLKALVLPRLGRWGESVIGSQEPTLGRKLVSPVQRYNVVRWPTEIDPPIIKAGKMRSYC